MLLPYNSLATMVINYCPLLSSLAVFLVFVIVTSAYGANVELQNGSETSKIKLTENQKNILKAYGLSEDEIANIANYSRHSKKWDYS